jgi:hypothetical protein
LLEKLHTNWPAACGPRGEVLDLHAERFPFIYHPGPNILSVVDPENGHAYYVKTDDTPLPYWEIGAPFRYILHTWFAARGLQIVHGGAVGGDGGGVLVAGRGGSGKSTTTLLCARAGMRYVGDDNCLVDAEKGYLYSVYDSAKLQGHEDLGRIPDLAGYSRNPDGFELGGEGKGIFFLSEVWPDRVASGFPLRAILVPQITGRPDSRLEPCSAADALLALMPSTLAQLPSANQADCERIAYLVTKHPTYILHLGTDVERVPALIESLIH